MSFMFNDAFTMEFPKHLTDAFYSYDLQKIKNVLQDLEENGRKSDFVFCFAMTVCDMSWHGERDAQKEGFPLQCMQLAFDHGFDPNSVPRGAFWVRDKVLSRAVLGNHTEMVRYLIEQGAKIDVLDRNNKSLLSVSICQGNEDIVRVLLDHGADPNAGDPSTWLEAAHPMRTHNLPALFEKGADINARNESGDNALHILAHGLAGFDASAMRTLGLPDRISWLIERGVAWNDVNGKGETPLDIATRNGCFAAADIFWALKADECHKNLISQTNPASPPGRAARL